MCQCLLRQCCRHGAKHTGGFGWSFDDLGHLLNRVIVSMGAVLVLRMESKSGIDIVAAVGSKDSRTSLSVSIFYMQELFNFFSKRRCDKAAGKVLGFPRPMKPSIIVNSFFWSPTTPEPSEHKVYPLLFQPYPIGIKFGYEYFLGQILHEWYRQAFLAHARIKTVCITSARFGRESTSNQTWFLS